MKKLFMAVILSLVASPAFAYTNSYDKGMSTYTVTGHKCSSDTATQLNSGDMGVSGYHISAYRITNLDSADDVYLGDVNVSTSAPTSGASGELLQALGNGTWQLGRGGPGSPTTKVALYCQAADSAGADGVAIAIAVFGYR